MTIKELLSNWKEESLFGERNFEKQPFSLTAGQELYLIKIIAKVNINESSKIIEKDKYFQTRVQGLTDDAEINPKGDEYICKQILAQLEDDFFKEYNAFIDEEIKKKTSP